MNQVKTFFFATLRDRVGMKSADLQIPFQTNVADLKRILIEKFPTLKELINHTWVAINHEYVVDETIISECAEIALFPPVSGG